MSCDSSTAKSNSITKVHSTKTVNISDEDNFIQIPLLSDHTPVTSEVEPEDPNHGLIDWEPEPGSRWDSLRIQDSPTLTTLIAALKIDEKIPLLSPPSSPSPMKYISMKQLEIDSKFAGKESAADKSTSRAVVPGSVKYPQKEKKKIEITFEFLERFVEKSYMLQTEVSPFPAFDSPKKRSYVAISHGSPSPLKLRISKCRAQLQTMRHLLPPSNSGILSTQRKLADLLHDDGQYKAADTLYLGIMRTYEEFQGPQHPNVVWLYLAIIRNRIGWGRLKQVTKIHHFFHDKIISVYGPRTEIGLASIIIMSEIYYGLMDYQQAERLQRQILQITLSSFGINNAMTLAAMDHLGKTLFGWNYLGSFRNCSAGLLTSIENLLRYSISIKKTFSDFQGEEHIHLSYNTFAHILIERQEYKECLAFIREQLRLAFKGWGLDHYDTLNISITLGKAFEMSGNLLAAENVCKFVLMMQGRSPPLPFSAEELLCIKTLNEYIIIIHQFQRWNEASARAEELYRARYNFYGPDNKLTTYAKDTLEYYYSKQHLYRDDEEFEERLRWVLEQGGLTMFHLENGRDQPGVLERELEELTEWYKEWIFGAHEPQKRKKTEGNILVSDPLLSEA